MDTEPRAGWQMSVSIRVAKYTLFPEGIDDANISCAKSQSVFFF